MRQDKVIVMVTKTTRLSSYKKRKFSYKKKPAKERKIPRIRKGIVRVTLHH